jgi:hypothetical protein
MLAGHVATDQPRPGARLGRLALVDAAHLGRGQRALPRLHLVDAARPRTALASDPAPAPTTRLVRAQHRPAGVNVWSQALIWAMSPSQK